MLSRRQANRLKGNIAEMHGAVPWSVCWDAAEYVAYCHFCGALSVVFACTFCTADDKTILAFAVIFVPAKIF